MIYKAINKMVASLLCALLLLVGTLSFGSVALAEEPSGPALGMTGASVQAGDSVDMDVVISGNPGILGATLEINFDSRLTLTGIEKGEAFAKLDMTKPGELTSGCSVHWDATDLDDQDVKDGTIAKLTFTVSDSATAGDSCFIRVVPVSSAGRADVYDRSLQPVDLAPASCSIVVQPGPTVSVTGIELDQTSLSFSSIGKTKQLSATVKPATATDKSVTWSSTNEDVATVSQRGLVTSVGEGEAAIEAKTTDGEFVASCKVSVSLPGPKVSLADAEVSILPARYIYTGKEIRPLAEVLLNGTPLKEGTDYLLFYENNVNAGIATITAVGVGGYSGAKAEAFQVERATQDITATDKTVAMGGTLDLKAKVNTNTKLTYVSSNPKVATVSAAGIVKPVSVGKVEIAIEAAEGENYEPGSKTVTVTVSKAANPLTVKAKAAKVKRAKVAKKKQTLKAAKVLSVSGAQGKVTYSLKKANKTKKFKVNARTGAVTVPKGTKKGTYKLKVTVAAAGNANYEAASRTVTVKVTVG